MSSLRDTVAVRGDPTDFAQMDSECAGVGPDAGASSSRDSATAEQSGGASRVRAFARKELAEMGFSSCVRVITRVVQRDTWLRVDRVTELVAWREGDDTLDVVYVPVHYRAPLRGSLEDVPQTWIQPVATVLAAVCALVADSECAGDASSKAAVPKKKQIVLSFTNTTEWKDYLEVEESPEGDESSHVSTLRETSAIGPQLPRLMSADPGWIVGQIERDDGRISFPGVATGLPVNLPDQETGLSRGPVCENGQPCEMILSGIPPMHAHTMFWPDADSTDVGVSFAGERTLAVLRAAGTAQYGIPLPENVTRLLWWFLPVGLLLLVAYGACNAVLSPTDTALGIARKARRHAKVNRLWSKVRHAALRIPLTYRSRTLRAGRRSDHEANEEAYADMDRHNREAADGVLTGISWQAGAAADASVSEAEQARIGQWLEDVAEWEELRRSLLEREKRVSGTVSDMDRALGAQWQYESIVIEANDLNDERVRLDKDVRKACRRAKGLVKEARLLAKNTRKFTKRIQKRDAGPGSVAATLASRVTKATKARTGAATAIAREAKALKARTHKLSLETRRILCCMDGKKYEIVDAGLHDMAVNLGKHRRKTEEYISRSFKSFGNTLVKFGSLAWVTCGPRWVVTILLPGVWLLVWMMWRRDQSQLGWAYFVIAVTVATIVIVTKDDPRQPSEGGKEDKDGNELSPRALFLFGVAVSAAILHAFIASLDDPTLNAVLFNVHEDFWALVYIGLGTIVFLASALRGRKYRIGKDEERDLSYWVPKAWSERSQRCRKLPSVFRRLRTLSMRAIGAYVLLLLVVVIVAKDPYLTCIFKFLEMVEPMNALRTPSDNNLSHWFLRGLVALFFVPAIFVCKNLPNDTTKGVGS